MNIFAQILRLHARAEAALTKLTAWHCLNAALALEMMIDAAWS